jgi:lysophospholipase L1-like esterase
MSLVGFVYLFTVLLSTTGCQKESISMKPIRIVLVGDSTVATYPEDSIKQGWGRMLGERFKPEVTVVNLARGGRSSKSFIVEGRWDKALKEHADYILIQFGHNDCPGKGERTTDPNGDYMDNLRKYVADARAAGAKPILVTSVARRQYTADGKIRDGLEPYVAAMRRVAAEQKAPLIDLNASSTALFESLGDAGSSDLSCSAEDRTHFSPKGARAIAGLVVEALRKAEPDLAAYLK